jgi:hypothetical protein
VVFTTHTLKEALAVWKDPDLESFIIGLLEAKATFKVVIYGYD